MHYQKIESQSKIKHAPAKAKLSGGPIAAAMGFVKNRLYLKNK